MVVNRRSVIKGAGAVGATVLTPGLPIWAHADEAPTETAPKGYVGLSSALINVRADVLTQAQDDTALTDVYYSICYAAAPSATDNALALYGSLVGQNRGPAFVANAFLRKDVDDPAVPGTSDSAVIARLTMAMWLFGIWYGGTEIANVKTSGQYLGGPYRHDFIVSARAYKSGWIWRFAQAHPMGFSNFRFGSWQAPPPSLDAYLQASG